MYKNITLRDWQEMNKPINELIVQASIIDGSSRNEKFEFSIGMNHSYIRLSPEKRQQSQIGKHDKLVLSAMQTRTDRRRRGSSNINRTIILNTITKNGIKNINLIPEIYFDTLGEYKFIISPEGNGIDCHRHYVAIISGCIPIIEENAFMRHKYRDLPILYTKNYSEITNEYLEKKYDEMIDKKYDFSNLFITNYDNKNKELIKKFSNFWCMKTQKKKFYD